MRKSRPGLSMGGRLCVAWAGWECMAVGMVSHGFFWGPGLHWKCCFWGHWSWWGHSETSRWGMHGGQSLQPFWHLGCLVDAFGGIGLSVGLPVPPRHAGPGDPTSLSFLGLLTPLSSLLLSPYLSWPALICLSPLLSLTAHCVCSSGLHCSFCLFS